mmetsp:Transcript_26234/g.40023  ORF Transcript_26234/g.40023 Transcript_26234/m.40023 type:complete len:205 (-) Transcript_26234:223-837(-)
MLYNFSVLALDNEVSLANFLHRLLQVLVQVRDLVLQDVDLILELASLLIHGLLGLQVLDSLGLFDGPLESLLPLFVELLLLLLSSFSQSIFGVQFHLHEVVILAVMFLDVSSQLLGVGLFQGVDGFVVVLESQQLLPEVFAAGIELLLGFHQVELHVLRLFFVLFLEVGLLLGGRLLEHLELALRVLLVFEMVLLEALDLVFEI